MDPYDLFLKGFYSPLHAPEKHFLTDDWFENYIDTYLDMDVKDQINPSNLNAFRKFIQVCASYSGQLVNYDGISRDIGVSAVTIKSRCVCWIHLRKSSFSSSLFNESFISAVRQCCSQRKSS